MCKAECVLFKTLETWGFSFLSSSRVFQKGRPRPEPEPFFGRESRTTSLGQLILLESSPAVHCAGHRHFVGILDVAAGWDAGGDAGDSDIEGAQGAGEPVGGGFAFQSGAGGYDDLVHFAAFDAGDQSAGAQLVRPHAVQGREGSMEDMVDALVAAGPLDGGDVAGLLHHADQALVAGGTGAIGAGIDVGDV